MNDYTVRRRAADRERKRMISERQKRMRGNRSLQHILAAIAKKAKAIR